MAWWASLAHTLLEQGEALPKAAEGSSGGSFQEEQVLVQGSEGARAWQGLDGMHKALLLSLRLAHHLDNKEGAGDEWRKAFHRAGKLASNLGVRGSRPGPLCAESAFAVMSRPRSPVSGTIYL